MLSKNQIKRIRALHRKKNRREQGLFLVEGEKMVAELLASSWPIESLYATEEFTHQYAAAITHKRANVFPATANNLATVGTLVTNNAAIAIVPIPTTAESPSPAQMQDEWVLALDSINDPGNLGALLRVADWYGIRHIVCSPNTAELHNPKVISASKGSFLRVTTHYLALEDYFRSLPSDTTVLGAYLEGDNIHTYSPSSQGGVLVMGSEAHGIHPSLAPYITHPITIPAFGQAESLNVAIATAIICDNLRRKKNS